MGNYFCGYPDIICNCGNSMTYEFFDSTKKIIIDGEEVEIYYLHIYTCKCGNFIYFGES